eukprot:7387020-Ditylum_brightwellii.AAC.1
MPLDWYFKFGRKLMLHILKVEENIQPCLPSKEKFDFFVETIAQKYPLLGDNKVYCTMDGLKLRLQMSGDHDQQEWFYNGWQHDHFVTNIFAFSPDGKIIATVINVPGSIHNSTV